MSTYTHTCVVCGSSARRNVRTTTIRHGALVHGGNDAHKNKDTHNARAEKREERKEEKRPQNNKSNRHVEGETERESDSNIIIMCLPMQRRLQSRGLESWFAGRSAPRTE
eukprot:EC791674.1.p3 GENE.EC791674.1~~EC791674.1.p3  ORF type:complete len:110 (-),score=20.18 EC791674.1:89-418(-)